MQSPSNEGANGSKETEQLIVQGREREQRAKMEARESNTEAWSQTQKAEMATDKADKLQQEIAAMKGRMTERGIVMTIGDVLFATGTATLSPMADNQISRLAAFMKEYPDRNMLIEGYTDSTGMEGVNPRWRDESRTRGLRLLS